MKTLLKIKRRTTSAYTFVKFTNLTYNLAKSSLQKQIFFKSITVKSNNERIVFYNTSYQRLKCTSQEDIKKNKKK